MLSLTEKACEVLKSVVTKEQNENERLFIRLSMGIG
ncbi:hypothetical protein SAMN05192533_101278 [Mesobacillus persicus]|uniref:Uncharacterized protein n=1 Tax=Mesobacillus persicus TaxID=930146 RepID=A0A1H7W5K1_9BACI|nr:hypothetical protein SAMN05192533_101278 [Mesobacillus persicus]